MQLQLVDTLRDGGIRPWQEARPNPIGDLAETQIDARRLDLIFIECAGRDDDPGLDQGRNQAVRQDALFVGTQTERHGWRPDSGWPAQTGSAASRRSTLPPPYPPPQA